jgi:hypothetical protein
MQYALPKVLPCVDLIHQACSVIVVAVMFAWQARPLVTTPAPLPPAPTGTLVHLPPTATLVTPMPTLVRHPPSLGSCFSVLP